MSVSGARSIAAEHKWMSMGTRSNFSVIGREGFPSKENDTTCRKEPEVIPRPFHDHQIADPQVLNGSFELFMLLVGLRNKAVTICAEKTLSLDIDS